MTDKDKEMADGGTVEETGQLAPASVQSRCLEDLPPAAQRALKEAQDRRAAYEEAEKARAREIGGRGGKEPVRYGDWEIKGLAIDF